MDLRTPPQHNEVQAKRKKNFVRNSLIVFFAIVLTTIFVDATDNLSNFSRSIIGSAILSNETDAPCSPEMSYISSPLGGFCIDTFEASPSEKCPYGNPSNQSETTDNLEFADCRADSKKGVEPWTNIARHQAELACAQAGKHLPSNEEWYYASLGTPDAEGNVMRRDCNVSSSKLSTTGSYVECVSAGGAYDMVGNVWEWVGESVISGEYDGRVLPEEGFVSSIDTGGVAIETHATKTDKSFHQDYFFVDHSSVRGMFRGGYFQSESDAGLYAVNAITPPSFTGAAVGFRCAK